MGSAARKPLSSSEQRANRSHPACTSSACERAVRVASPESPALIISFDHNADSTPPSTPQQTQPQGSSRFPIAAAATDVSRGAAFSSGPVTEHAPPPPPSVLRVHPTLPRSPHNISGGSFNYNHIGGGEDSPQKNPHRHFVRRPTQSSSTSSLPNDAGSTLNSLREGTATVTTMTSTMAAAAAAAVVVTAASAASPTSLNSSCSAFSLYSAESSLRELPPMPAHAPNAERCFNSSATHSPVHPPAHLPPLATIEAVSSSSAQGVSASAAVSQHAASVPSTGVSSSTSRATPPLRSSSVGPTTTTISTALPFPPPPPPIPPVGQPAVSNFLLDMSFDSRTLTTNSITTSAEIQRIGIRLQKYQRSSEHSTVSGGQSSSSAVDGPRPTALTALTHNAAMTSSASFSPTETPLERLATPQRTPLASSAPSGLSSEFTAGSTPFYAETVKFVQVIQELQRARDAGRASYTWFRPEALQSAMPLPLPVAAAAATMSASSAPVSSDNAAGSGHASSTHTLESSTRKNGSSDGRSGLPVQSSSSLRDNGPSSSFSESGRNGHDEEADRRASMRRRDRLLTLVHWAPFESRECEPMSLFNPVAVCFCGYSATSEGAEDCVMHGEGAAQESETEAGTATPPMAIFTDTETPPLPPCGLTSTSTSTSTAAASFMKRSTLNEADKQSPVPKTESPISANASGPQLTSSTATSSPSNPADSLSYCPLHGAYNPPSIFILHHGERSRNHTNAAAPVKRPPLASAQIDVPSSAVSTPRPMANSLPVALPERRAETRWAATNAEPGSHSSDSAETAKRAIIEAGVPHQRQLAKKALEENNLFFESLMKQRKTNPPCAEVQTSAET